MRILFSLCLLFTFTIPAGHAEAVRFFESIQDLPLMPGLVERAEDSLAFDKPEGRIVESVAEMQNLSGQAVRDYYGSTLPQFGWHRAGPNRFVRRNESLELAFEALHGVQIMRVSIHPR